MSHADSEYPLVVQQRCVCGHQASEHPDGGPCQHDAPLDGCDCPSVALPTRTEATTRSHPMTVARLIEHLSALPADALVYVRGYEGGLNDPERPTPVTVIRNWEWSHDRWYYGPHLETKHLDQYDVAPDGTEPVGYFIDRAE